MSIKFRKIRFVLWYATISLVGWNSVWLIPSIHTSFGLHNVNPVPSQFHPPLLVFWFTIQCPIKSEDTKHSFSKHRATFLYIFLCRNLGQNYYLNLLSPCIPVGTKASFLLMEPEQGYIAINIENNLQEPPKSSNLKLFLFVSLIYLFQQVFQ